MKTGAPAYNPSNANNSGASASGSSLAAFKSSAPFVPSHLASSSGSPSATGLAALKLNASEYKPSASTSAPAAVPAASASAPSSKLNAAALLNAPEFRPSTTYSAGTATAATAGTQDAQGTWGDDAGGNNGEGDGADDYQHGDYGEEGDEVGIEGGEFEDEEYASQNAEEDDILEGMTYFTPYGAHPYAHMLAMSVQGLRSPTVARSPYLSRNFGGPMNPVNATSFSRAPLPMFIDDKLAESLQDRISLLSLRALPEDRTALAASQAAATQAAANSAAALNPQGSEAAAALAAAISASNAMLQQGASIANSAVLSDICPLTVSAIDMDEPKRDTPSATSTSFRGSFSQSSAPEPGSSASPFTITSATYSNLFPIPSDMSRAIIGAPSLPYMTHSFKAQCNEDGRFVMLKRVAGVKVNIAQAKAAVEPWMQLHRDYGARNLNTKDPYQCNLANHPNIVALRNIFMTADFSDKRSLCFAYDFHPGAQTLFQRHLCGANTIPNVTSGVPFTESLFWQTAVQLLVALSAIHAAKLTANGMLDPTGSRVLWLPSGRIKLAGAGYLATVMEVPTQIIAHPLQRYLMQHQDLVNFGKLLLALSCQSLTVLQSAHTVARALQTVSTTLSPECARFLTSLLVVDPAVTAAAAAINSGDPEALGADTQALEEQGPPPGFLTANRVLSSIAHKIVPVMESIQSTSDMLEEHLAREFHNGRLLRLLLKLGYINERPEFQQSPHWADTGDRYPLKLFRDYIFHQVNADGTPAVDIGFTIDCLNKLDAGTNENVLLSSRQEDSLLVVSYRDLNRCLHAAFHELFTAAPTKIDAANTNNAQIVVASALALGHAPPSGPSGPAHGLVPGANRLPPPGSGRTEPPPIALTASSVKFLASLAGASGVAAKVASAAAAAHQGAQVYYNYGHSGHHGYSAPHGQHGQHGLYPTSHQGPYYGSGYRNPQSQSGSGSGLSVNRQPYVPKGPPQGRRS